MKLLLLADCYGSHVHGRAGDVVASVPDELAQGMIDTGHAERIDEVTLGDLAAADGEGGAAAPPAARRQTATRTRREKR